ncbi:YdcH family protein [Vibrio hepatarius]|jgi:uncharacterized protein YdcH (DUF465 family)|uniref:GTP-binding protein n=1 Tax=Vibrio hepatarius TaxID=171383 RepID=A0A0M0I0F6_9VIBR|nr:DUF465 domain-containing protein [Vibrio hepatarius]KOO07562.1 hypothetical protein AKJ31_11795 [Vibrio hepatarius]NOI14441.1 DUF465 domain-containing protein [Vibrio hepatarius]
MLGEDHSLLSEFPEYKDTITALAKSDETFLDEMKQYDLLDKEIRKLELRDSPISDEEMLKMKQNRAAMKDELHARIQSAAE